MGLKLAPPSPTEARFWVILLGVMLVCSGFALWSLPAGVVMYGLFLVACAIYGEWHHNRPRGSNKVPLE
jgi:hypothetical protein